MLSNVVIPIQAFLPLDYADALGVDCSASTGDIAVFNIPFKCQVYMAGIVVTETCAGTTSTPTVNFNFRPTAGSTASMTTGTIAALTVGTAVAGKLMYDLVAVGETAGILNAGDQVIVDMTVAAAGTGAAGHFYPHLLVKYWPETIANQSDMVATA